MDGCYNLSASGYQGVQEGVDHNSNVTSHLNFTDVINQVLLPAVCVFGIVGNLLNLAILTRRKLQKSFRTLEQAANLCLIFLAVSDLMFCLFAFLTIFAPPGDRFEERGILLAYSTYCAAIINVFIMESTLLTVAMSLERFLAICFPLRQDIYLTTRRIKYIIFFTFLFSICFNIPVFWRYEVVVICLNSTSDILPDRNLTSHTISGNFSQLSESSSGIQLLPYLNTSDSAMATFTDFAEGNQNTNNYRNSQNFSLPPSLSSIFQFTASHSTFSIPSWSLSPTPPGSSSSAKMLSPSFSPIQLRYTTRMVLLGGSAAYDTAYRIIWAVVGNFIPLILLLYFNVCLWRKIYRSYKLRKSLGRQGQPRSSSHVLTVTLVAIVALFFLLVTPSEVALLVSHMTSRGGTPLYQNIEAVFNLMQAINFSVNFILYCIISPYFRKTLKYMVLCGCYNIYQVPRDWKKEFETSLM